MGSGKWFSLSCVLGGSLRRMNGIVAFLAGIVNGNLAQTHTRRASVSHCPSTNAPAALHDSCLCVAGCFLGRFP